MPKFFIERPIFAWVIAIFVMLAGIVSITQLPISQYPSVAPPTIRVSATYPGATAQTLDENVLAVIEREMNGAEGLMYTEYTAQSNGNGELNVTFEPGTDPNLAQVDVQNRLARVEPKLPAVVKQIGVRVDKASSNFLMILAFQSTSESVTRDDVADYVNRNVLPEVQRIEGVGSAQLFASGRALRVWTDPGKLQGYGLSMQDVSNAIQSQNIQISGGDLAGLPATPGQTMTATIVVPGQITNADELANMVLRANPDIPYDKRIETARFIEDLTASYQGGWYSIISLHGGGSPEAMKREIYRNYPVGSKVALVERLMDRGLTEDPDRAITRNTQPGKCCAQGCTVPGTPVMVDLPALPSASSSV